MLRTLLIPLLLVATGCAARKPVVASTVNYFHELPAGTLALQKLAAEDYPSFAKAASAQNLPGLLNSIDHSLAYLAKPASQKFFPYADISHDRAVATLTTLRHLIDIEFHQPLNDEGARFDAAVKSSFEVYKSLGGYDAEADRYTGDVLFTGYCTPTYDASLTRTGAYQWPLYKRPADLLDPPARSTPGSPNQRRRLPSGLPGPAFTRGQIEQQHALDGDELVYLPDRFSAYIITIQGSARLKLSDGTILEVGFNGDNGYDYVSIGKQMIADGAISKDQISLDTLKRYFTAHPRAMDHYLPLNPREVFFSEQRGGPFGSLGQQVTPLATIATDKNVYPRAMPAFLTVDLTTDGSPARPFAGILCDQDTGGAINAAGRCDIYLGLGEQGGNQLSVGKLYYLALRPELVPGQ